MKKLLFLLTILPFILSAASFDCDKAKTEVEKLICKDPELSKLDDEMGKVYKSILEIANNDDKKKIKQEQLSWLKDRELHNEDNMAFFYRTRIGWLRSAVDTLRHRPIMVQRIFELQKIEHYPTYAEVLNNNISFPKITKKNLMAEVRPANSFQLIGGIKNPVCKEALTLFNERGTYKLDFDLNLKVNSSPEKQDKLFWYLNNSGLIMWEMLDGDTSQHYSVWTFAPFIQYVEVDIDNDGKNEYAYRYSTAPRGSYNQNIYIFNEKLQDSITLLEGYKNRCERSFGKEKCNSDNLLLLRYAARDYTKMWKSTQDIDNSISRIVYNKQSLDILYPNNSIKMVKNVALDMPIESNAQWNLYKTQYGTVMVLVPWWWTWQQAPEFLVFSLHRDKLATLECIIMPKEWQ